MIPQPQGQSNQKRILTYVFFGALILAGGFAVWYFFFRDTTQCDPYRTGFDTDGKPTDKCKAINASTATPPPPSLGVGSSWKDETWPLQKGMIGLKIKSLQQVLGITADGKFGPKTEESVMKVLNGKKTVDQADYEKLVQKPGATPPSGTTNTTTVEVGKTVYSNKPGTPIWSSLIDITPYRFAGDGEKLGEYLGTKKSWVGNSFARVKWDGGEKYVSMDNVTIKE